MRRVLAAKGLFRASLLTATVLGGALAVAGERPEAFPIRIISPGASDLVIGRTDVSVETTPPAGGQILKIELIVDDALVGTLLDPPWTFSWDAGDSARPRTLRVRAWASNGMTATTRITTRAVVGVQRTQVTLVEVYATVRDSGGVFLRNLDKQHFTVLESGKPQEIAVFTAERKPANLVLLMDTSGSMKSDDRLTIAQEAAAGFVEALEPEDRAGLITFSDVPVLLQAPTTDRKSIEAGILSAKADGGTALYDAVMMAASQLKGVEGRKAIILLSDGRDESQDGMGPGSIATWEEALDELLRAEIAVYVIGTGEKLASEYDYHHRRTLGDLLGTLATRSGGRALFVKRASRLKAAYREIEDELRHQYTLAYYPVSGPEPTPRRGEKPGWRTIEVRVSRARARVTARDGYYAK